MSNRKNIEEKIVTELLRNFDNVDKLLVEYPIYVDEIKRAYKVIRNIYGNGVVFGIRKIRGENKQYYDELYLLYEGKNMKAILDNNTIGNNILSPYDVNTIKFKDLENIYEEIVNTYNYITDNIEKNIGFLNHYSVGMEIHWYGFESPEALTDIEFMKTDLSVFKCHKSKREIVSVYMYDKAQWDSKTVDKIASGLPKFIEDEIMKGLGITLYKLKKLEEIVVYAISDSLGSMFDVSIYFENKDIFKNFKFINAYKYQPVESD